MTIDPSNVCQLRCPGCHTGLDNERRRRKAKKLDHSRAPVRLKGGVLDSILDDCGDILFYCHFYNWGEPLLNEALPDYIRSASDRGIYTKVDTNLSLKCSDQKLEQLLLSGIDEIAVSLDGFSQETYQKYRVNGRFDLALGNLTRLVDLRQRLGVDTKLIWNMLIFAYNEHELSDVAAFCSERNIEFVARDAVFTQLMPADWQPAYRREGKPNPYRLHRPAELTSSAWATPSGVLPLFIGKPKGRTCAWHYGYTVVNANGGVHPCCGLYKPSDDFGRVTEEPKSFSQIWNNANFEAVRREFPQGEQMQAGGTPSVCLRCRRSETYRDHYTVLDREIMVKYWSLSAESEARQLDEFFTLLQKSPAEFVDAYAVRYGEVNGNCCL
jgi:MoaA/NifB/PqqE/SkfB family radical SAM enzyme